MHPRKRKLGALWIALGVVLTAGSAWAGPRQFERKAAERARFQGWTPLSHYVSAGLAEGGSFRLSVPTRGGPVEVVLRPVAVAAADYHAEEAVHGGNRRGRARPAVETFAGTIEEDGADTAARSRGGDFLRLAQEPGGQISGLMRVDGVLYDLAADPGAGDLVLAVREVDAAELAEALGSCAAGIDDLLASQAPAFPAGVNLS
jgi:hypothetical protein